MYFALVAADVVVALVEVDDVCYLSLVIHLNPYLEVGMYGISPK